MNNNYLEQKKNTHLYFQIGKNKYAINTANVLEIMKLPALDYPQKLPNNIIGLLKYNNFVINVVDIRFYLNIEGAIIPVQRLRRMVEEYDFDYNGVKAKVTVSIGLTMNYQNLNNSADILKSADEALYRAKEEGRNRVILHEQ